METAGAEVAGQQASSTGLLPRRSPPMSVSPPACGLLYLPCPH
jgi:hypothetical protein